MKAGEKGISNQAKVRIHKGVICNKYNRYVITGYDAGCKVLSNLGAAAFALYWYFAANAAGYVIDLSPRAIELATGIKYKQYLGARNALVEAGYLVDSGDVDKITNQRIYDFWDDPYSKNAEQKDDADPSLQNGGSLPPKRCDQNGGIYIINNNLIEAGSREFPAPHEEETAAISRAEDTERGNRPKGIKQDNGDVVYDDGTTRRADGTYIRPRGMTPAQKEEWEQRKQAGAYSDR